MGCESQELRLRLFQAGEVVRLLSQPTSFELLPLPRLQLFVGLLNQHHDVRHPGGREYRVSIDVPDLIRCRHQNAFCGEVGLWLTAYPNETKQLDDRVLIISAEYVADGLAICRHPLQHEHPGKGAVSVSESEVVVMELEETDPHRQGLQDTREQLDRPV